MSDHCFHPREQEDSLQPENRDDYELLELRLKTLLPEEYRDSYEDVKPVSMGSAGLKLGPDGRVLWDEIWGSFCHLAMAGGPPHRGRLLAAASKASTDLDPERYLEVVTELCRGVEMVTGLAAEPASVAGWLDVDCPSTSMAGWLARAINMENVSAHVDGMVLHLPAGPHFRLEKEIKNVITSIAKTCHYWLGHTSVAQHRAIADLFRILDSESPLIQPPFPPAPTKTTALENLRSSVAVKIHSQTGFRATGLEYPDWLGMETPDVHAAVWIMRVMVASNVLCRREENFVYVPINPSSDSNGERITTLVERAYRIARDRGVL